MASTTVKNGTSAIEVVKVRLLALRPSRSSRNRTRKVDAVSRQGKCIKAYFSEEKDMAGIMPSP